MAIMNAVQINEFFFRSIELFSDEKLKEQVDSFKREAIAEPL